MHWYAGEFQTTLNPNARGIICGCMGMKYRVLLFLKLKGVLKQFRSIFCMYVFSTKFQAETDLNMNIIIWGFLHKKLFFFFKFLLCHFWHCKGHKKIISHQPTPVAEVLPVSGQSLHWAQGLSGSSTFSRWPGKPNLWYKWLKAK